MSDTATDTPVTEQPSYSAHWKRSYVEGLIETARIRLHLTAYDITLDMADAPSQDDENCDAECKTAFPYLNARLVVYPCFFACDPKRQRHIILHELAHVITQPMKAACHRLSSEKLVTWQEVLDRNEHLTDWIARIAGDQR